MVRRRDTTDRMTTATMASSPVRLDRTPVATVFHSSVWKTSSGGGRLGNAEKKSSNFEVKLVDKTSVSLWDEDSAGYVTDRKLISQFESTRTPSCDEI